MSDLVVVMGFVVPGALCYALALWWFEARTTWMSRLSARGLLDGHYEPYRGGGWGSPRWVLRQRLSTSDMGKLEDLKHKPDADRATEVWRVRAVRRQRLVWVCAPAVLIGPLVFSVLVDAPWPAWIVTGGSVLVLWLPGRAVYRRLRDWGEYDASTPDPGQAEA
jgi:hypothetical protein